MNAITFAALALAAGTAASAQPRDTVRIDAGPGSRVWIEGSSNVVDWQCQAQAFDARVELDTPQLRLEAGLGALRAVNITVAVRDLKCGNRKMERDLYSALEAADPAHPSFIIGRFQVMPDSVPGAITTRGSLSVAGVDQTVTVPISAERGADGSLRARGAVSLLMTDFGVKPPVGLFGLIRSHNKVTVRFDLLVPPRIIASDR